MYNEDESIFEKYNTISKLYDAVSAQLASSPDDLADRLRSVHDTIYLLYQKRKEKLGYRQTLKDSVGDKAEEEVKEQKQDDDK